VYMFLLSPRVGCALIILMQLIFSESATGDGVLEVTVFMSPFFSMSLPRIPVRGRM